MAATQTPGVSADEFNALIEGAVNRRSSCFYQHFRAFHFHWADDNTFPERDQESFTAMCKILGFPTVESHVLQANDPTPGNTIRDRINSEVRAATQLQGRTILIIHYAGHGADNGTGQLVISDRLGRKLARADLLMAEFDSVELSLAAPIDVLYIFDCCFGYLATRDITPGSRMVEVVSGNDVRDPIALGAKNAYSFTSKLLVEIRSRAQQGEKELEIADLIASLPSTVKQPTHSVKAGIGSIVLPIPPGKTATAQSQPRPGILSTFTIHTMPSFEPDEVKGIVDWIHTFPNTRRMSLQYEGAKRVNSTLFFFQAKRLAYLRISGAPGVTLICENRPFPFPSVRASHAAVRFPTTSKAHRVHSPNKNTTNDENLPPAQNARKSLGK